MYDFIYVWLIDDSRFTFHDIYSVLKLFTGFAIAALIVWKLIVNSMIIMAIAAAIINTPGESMVLPVLITDMGNSMIIVTTNGIIL